MARVLFHLLVSFDKETSNPSRSRKKMNRETRSTTTSTAEVIDNADLLIEILLLLPAKCLIRLKSVSKHWLSLISDASFSHLHTLRHRKPQTSFLLRASASQFFHFSPTRTKFVPLRFNFSQAKIRQSCNGLLLLDCGHPHNDYYVYNPTTGESRNLLLKPDRVWGLFLAFDPSKSPHYKVICLRSTSYSILRNEMEVYDSEMHTWRREESVCSNPPPSLRDWVYCENYIYALSYDGSIFSFDIEKLIFRTLPLDISNRIRQLRIFDITESGGHVYFIAHNDVTNDLEVSEITERGCNMSFMFKLNFNYITASFHELTRKFCFLGFIGRNAEERCLVFHVPGKVMVYCFDEYHSRCEELLDLKVQGFYKEGRLQFGYHDAYQFIESLAPV